MDAKIGAVATGDGTQDEAREARIVAKMAEIRSNTGESRSDDEIRAQAIKEIDAEVAE